MLPLLLASGGGAVAWRRVRRTQLQHSKAAPQLQEQHRSLVLETALREREIVQAFAELRAAGIEPLLGKGWAAARLYPEPGLRPLGDVDLYVRAVQHHAALVALGIPVRSRTVDVHAGCPELDDRDFEDLFRRSRLVPLEDLDVRVFGPEDHLRLLCLHFLRHGAWRPLSLCDVAASLESLPPRFDWPYFLGGDRRRTEWVIATLGLAHHLLGAEIDHTPVAQQARRLPRWLAPAVLRQWGQGKSRTAHGECPPLSAAWPRPMPLLDALRCRWPNPIYATVSQGGAFDNAPRLPYQLANWLDRLMVAATGRRVTRATRSALWDHETG